MDATLKASIARQRKALMRLLRRPLAELAERCRAVWGDRLALDQALAETLERLPYCRHLYVVDRFYRQISDNVDHAGAQPGFGRDRSDRPYMQGLVEGASLLLSDSYLSLRERRPSLTALRAVRDGEGRLLGWIGAYFALRDLPLTRELYPEPRAWRQIKGDPSIRSTVFHQARVESELDRRMDAAIGVLVELMRYHGVYHVMLHFASSRAVIWQIDDPLRYRLLSLEELTDPDTCLAYPRHPYPAEALVPEEAVLRVFELFKALRLMDETFYLRSGTLNLYNGIVGLTFSCDGSHYVPCEDFLAQGKEFWLGASV
ncbi:MAG: hypothetical protein N2441_06675 [Rhodocyclaceae bacterium]|nr:hypothetical protein [Rhodocyclaceae bacterium]